MLEGGGQDSIKPRPHEIISPPSQPCSGTGHMQTHLPPSHAVEQVTCKLTSLPAMQWNRSHANSPPSQPCSGTGHMQTHLPPSHAVEQVTCKLTSLPAMQWNRSHANSPPSQPCSGTGHMQTHLPPSHAVEQVTCKLTSLPAMQWKKYSCGLIPVRKRPSTNPPALGLGSYGRNDGRNRPLTIMGGRCPSSSI